MSCPATVCSLSRDPRTPEVFTLCGRLDDQDFLRDPITLRNAAGDTVTLELCFPGPSCRLCDPDKIMFYAHQCCWKLARQHHGPVSADTLYNLAWKTRPLMDWRYLMDILPQSSIDLLHSKLPSNTNLSDLLHKAVLRLPPELRHEIAAHLRQSVVFSLLSTRCTLQFLDLIGPSTGTNSQPFATPKTTAIYAKSIHLFGSAYLRQLEFAEDDRLRDGDSASISIVNGQRAVQGLNVVLGAYGLRAARVIYCDGSFSPWLGNPASGWYATLSGNDLHKLSAIQDVSTTGISTGFSC